MELACAMTKPGSRSCAAVLTESRGVRRGFPESTWSNRLHMPSTLDRILIDVAAGKPEGVEQCLNRFSSPVWSLARLYLTRT